MDAHHFQGLWHLEKCQGLVSLERELFGGNVANANETEEAGDAHDAQVTRGGGESEGTWEGKDEIENDSDFYESNYDYEHRDDDLFAQNVDATLNDNNE